MSASRRSTRVPLRIVVEVRGSRRSWFAKLEGALISTAIPLSVRRNYACVSDRQTCTARVVYSIPSSHSNAELNWINLETFGDCHCRPRTGGMKRMSEGSEMCCISLKWGTIMRGLWCLNFVVLLTISVVAFPQQDSRPHPKTIPDSINYIW